MTISWRWEPNWTFWIWGTDWYPLRTVLGTIEKTNCNISRSALTPWIGWIYSLTNEPCEDTNSYTLTWPFLNTYNHSTRPIWFGKKTRDQSVENQNFFPYLFNHEVPRRPYLKSFLIFSTFLIEKPPWQFVTFIVQLKRKCPWKHPDQCSCKSQTNVNKPTINCGTK